MMMWLLAVESRLSPVHHLSVPNAQASFKLTADFSVHSSASAFATLPNKFTTLFQEGNLTCIVFFSILQNVNHVNKIQPILSTLRLIISGEAFVFNESEARLELQKRSEARDSLNAALA
jgi:hypothetical protein